MTFTLPNKKNVYDFQAVDFDVEKVCYPKN